MSWSDRLYRFFDIVVDVLAALLLVTICAFLAYLGFVTIRDVGIGYGLLVLVAPAVLVAVALSLGVRALRDRLFP